MNTNVQLFHSDSAPQYDTEDNFHFSDGKSRRKMIILMIIVIADMWESKGEDSVSQWENRALGFFYLFNILLYSNTRRNAPLQRKKLDEFMLYSFQLCKAMCPLIHHYLLSIDTIRQEFVAS